MGNILSFSVATLCSLTVHAVVLALLFFNWQPEPERKVITPQYIEARLVELKPKETPKPKAKPRPQKPKVDTATKRRAEEKRRADQKRKQDQKRQADLKRKKEAERKAHEKKAREEAERKTREREQQRKRIESEFAEALEREQQQQSEATNEQLKMGYLQLIQQTLEDNWSRPPSARLGMEAVMRIRLVPTGRIVGTTLIKSSGDAAFDRSVEQAVANAEQFPELQQLYKESPQLFEREFRQIDIAFSPDDLRL